MRIFSFHIELTSLERPESNYSLSTYGWIVGQLGSLTFVWQPVSEKENSHFNLVKLRFKNWPRISSSSSVGIGHHHHNHVVTLARISLTLFATSPYRSSPLAGLQGYIPYLHIVAKCIFELVVHESTSFMSSSLLLQQCHACLVRLTLIIFVMGGRWPYSWCLVGCCRLDLFNIARSILV